MNNLDALDTYIENLLAIWSRNPMGTFAQKKVCKALEGAGAFCLPRHRRPTIKMKYLVGMDYDHHSRPLAVWQDGQKELITPSWQLSDLLTVLRAAVSFNGKSRL